MGQPLQKDLFSEGVGRKERTEGLQGTVDGIAGLEGRGAVKGRRDGLERELVSLSAFTNARTARSGRTGVSDWEAGAAQRRRRTGRREA